MKILIACEESQTVTKEFRLLGHEAFSCDIEPCSGGHPEWHIQGDVTPLLEQDWDMIVAFPPVRILPYQAHHGSKRSKPMADNSRALTFLWYLLQTNAHELQ